jgi:hypothetical protein
VLVIQLFHDLQSNLFIVDDIGAFLTVFDLHVATASDTYYVAR